MSFLDAFIMPKQVTIMARSSSITNSFVNGIIPCIAPTEEEVAAALLLLGMGEDDVVCAYCGDPVTEWDHLNPLVKNKRPTGFVSEIHNLVPSCGKCNQSKGNKPWRKWIVSSAKKSPLSRGVPDLDERIRRLEEYESAFEPIRLDFESIVEPELWEAHWRNLEHLHDVMQQCQAHSNLVRQAITDSANKAVDNPKHPTSTLEGSHTSNLGPSSETQTRQHQAYEQTPAKESDVYAQLPPDLKGIDTVGNKDFASRCLEHLESHDLNLRKDLDTLCSKEGCKSAFNHDQALLKRVDSAVDQAATREDGHGYARYYATPKNLLGQCFLISKEWYGLGKNERDNRTPFLKWVLSRT
ncbi:MAG: HNH endonuclease [Atopobiaceae bacterium]|nr:HNH endonuclease [Atopobiaceae bacterium]